MYFASDTMEGFFVSKIGMTTGCTQLQEGK